MKTTELYKQGIIDAAKIGVEELIKVLKEPIITGDETDVSADRLKNAVQTKKIAMMDALEMMSRIDVEQTNLKEGKSSSESLVGFAEQKSKK